ncbi:MAG: DUF4417 domain-containing protein [Bullifex sp.]
MRIDLIGIANDLYEKLTQAGIVFNSKGYPVFSERYFLHQMPDEIIPFTKRKYASNKKTALVCFFEEDEFLYSFLLNIDKYIDELREYIGIGGFDLSPDIFWDDSLQQLNILLSQMVTIYVAIHDVKIIPNWRIGSLQTIDSLCVYPKHSTFIVGTHGSQRTKNVLDDIYVRAKLMVSNPSNLLIYGGLHKKYFEVLKEEDISYTIFKDYKSQILSGKEAC